MDSPEVYYILEEDSIVFSGSATDCKRIAAKLPNCRIEPPLIKRKKAIQSQFEFWDR